MEKHLIFEIDGNQDAISTMVHQVLPYLNESKCLVLFGEIGSGKTSFCKALLHHLQPGTEVSSPTFNLVNEYSMSNGTFIYHFDLYRVKSADELYEIGFREYLNSGQICIIEWPEIGLDFLSETYLQLEIEYVNEGERKYKLSKVN